MDDQRLADQMYREMMAHAAGIAQAARHATHGQVVRVTFSHDLRFLTADVVPGDDARRLGEDEAARVFYLSRDWRDVDTVRRWLRLYFGKDS